MMAPTASMKAFATFAACSILQFLLQDNFIVAAVDTSALSFSSSHLRHGNAHRELGGGGGNDNQNRCPATSPLGGNGGDNGCNPNKFQGVTCSYEYIYIPTVNDVEKKTCNPNDTGDDMACNASTFCDCDPNQSEWVCASFGVVPCADDTEPQLAYTSCTP